MDDVEEQVKGISFWATSDSVRSPDGHRQMIEVTLIGEASASDEELVKKVIKKMHEGFRIYSENDFQAEIQELMRQELTKEETAHALTRKALELEIANRMRVEEKLKQYEAIAGQLGSALRNR